MNGHALLVGPEARPFGPALARALRLPHRQLTGAVGDEPVEVEAVLMAESDPEVALTVVPRERLAGDEAVEALALGATKPLVLLPIHGQSVAAVSRVLVPLDGSLESSEAASLVRSMFGPSGAEVLLLHVFEPATVPPFWDQPHHASQSWAQELVMRSGRGPGTRIETRSGRPVDVIDEMARAENADLIALGWCQSADPERCHVVRSMLNGAQHPLMLIGRAGIGERP